MGRRTLLLIAAVIVAAIGTTLVFLYVQGINDRAVSRQRLVTVLVAKTRIEANTSGQDAAAAGAFESKAVPQSTVADGVLSDVTPIKNLVALAPIYPGEQIISNRFGKPSESSSSGIPKGKIAISVNLGDPNRVAQLLSQGSQVAIFVTAKFDGKDGTRLLLPTVTVLQTGQNSVVTKTTTDTSGTKTQEQFPNALLTLAVSPTEAEKIIFAQSQGELYFGLLTGDSQPGKPGDEITQDNLFTP
jgi:pilus assembly protein CpaB